MFLICHGSSLPFPGTAPDPIVWSAGALPRRRRLVHAVRNLAMLPGPLALWLGERVTGPAVTDGVDDVSLAGGEEGRGRGGGVDLGWWYFLC